MLSHVAQELRSTYLRPLPAVHERMVGILRAAVTLRMPHLASSLERATLEQLRETCTLVGVHSRRTDMAPGGSSSGLAGCLPDPAWYRMALDHVRRQFDRPEKPVVFVVASDNVTWFHQHVLGGKGANTFSVDAEGTNPHATTIVGDVVLLWPRPMPKKIPPKNGKLVNRWIIDEAALDLLLVGNCHHAIWSYGSFGWWAAWLTGGRVFYSAALTKKPGKKAGGALCGPMARLVEYKRVHDHLPPHWTAL